MIRLDNVSKQVGHQILFIEASAALQKGEKIGLLAGLHLRQGNDRRGLVGHRRARKSRERSLSIKLPISAAEPRQFQASTRRACLAESRRLQPERKRPLYGFDESLSPS